MRLPRDVSGDDLVRALQRFGYQIVRQSSSHVRLTTYEHGEHHLTVPRHDSLRVGTLASIVRDVAEHFEIDREEVIARLFR